MSLNKPMGITLLLIWCLFMGVTAISIGVGAAFPPLNQIAQPFICSNGQLQVLMSTSHPQPSVTYTAEEWQCVDNQTGQAHDIDEWGMFLINGLIYGSLLFVVIMIWWWIRTKRRAQRVAKRAAVDVPTAYTPRHTATSSDTSAETYKMEIELSQLKKLRDEDLITEEDYQQKKLEILSRL